jgi:FO synthase subunit 2
MRHLIRDIGRIPAERTTTYEIRQQFGPEEDDCFDPLDLVHEEDEERFGSYAELARSPRFRFEDQQTIPLVARE